MDTGTRERWGAATGLVSIACSAVAVMFERGTVSAGDTPTRISAYFSDNQQELRTQALLFILGLGFTLWFIPTLTSHLGRAEGGQGRLAGIALVSGVTSVGLTFVALVFQIGLATAAHDAGQPALVAIMNAVFTVAGLPLVVMLIAVALVSLRTRVLPAWLAWLSGVAAVTQLIPVLGVVADSGPLASGGWLSAYLPYPLYAVWVVCVAVLLIRAAGTDPA